MSSWEPFKARVKILDETRKQVGAEIHVDYQGSFRTGPARIDSSPSPHHEPYLGSWSENI